MKQNKIKWVMLAIITGIFMAGIDGTIVATAFQTISKDFNNPSNIYWITIAYITANVAIAPIVGKLSDMYGRKKFFVLGLLLFLIGSLLSGLSTTINQLIIFRIIQGLGAGALFPVAFAIIYDIYPSEKRGKITGIISAIFGISAIAGPIVGGIILETLPWQGIFFVNIPIGIISLIAIIYGYHESNQRTKDKIDYLGVITYLIAIISFMLAIEFIGQGVYELTDTITVLLGSLFITFTTLFLYIETKVSSPIMPLKFFKSKLFTTSVILIFISGMFTFATTHLAMYMQVVLHYSIIKSGIYLIPFVLGTAIGANIAGIMINKKTYRFLSISGLLVAFIGFTLLSTITLNIEYYKLAIYMVIAGAGMGVFFPLGPLALVQDKKHNERGTATSLNSMFRNTGAAVGFAIFGALRQNVFNSETLETNIINKLDQPTILNKIAELSTTYNVPKEQLQPYINNIDFSNLDYTNSPISLINNLPKETPSNITSILNDLTTYITNIITNQFDLLFTNSIANPFLYAGGIAILSISIAIFMGKIKSTNHEK